MSKRKGDAGTTAFEVLVKSRARNPYLLMEMLPKTFGLGFVNLGDINRRLDAGNRGLGVDPHSAPYRD